MAYRITVVEDNEPDVFLLQDSLRQAEVDCALTLITDGAEARNHFSAMTRDGVCRT